MQITPEPLTAAAFAPYGEVLALDKAATDPRQAFAAGLENRRPDATLNLSIIRHEPTALPLKLEWLECHLYSAQTFVPLEMSRFLVLACHADADGGPSLEALQVFIGTADQGVNYKPNVWHHPFTVLDQPSQCIMLRFDARNEEDTIWFEVKDGASIVDIAAN